MSKHNVTAGSERGSVFLRVVVCGVALCLAVWAAVMAFRYQPETAAAEPVDMDMTCDGYVLEELTMWPLDTAELEALLAPDEPEADAVEADEPESDEKEPVQEETSQPVEETQEETVSSDPAQRVLELVNRHRASCGRAPLTLDSTLCSAAMTRARETTSVFSHVRPNGTQWYTVSSLAHAENIVMGTGMDADKAMEKWMNSPPHRESILDASYSTLGVGWYKSGSEVYWVQLFGY